MTASVRSKLDGMSFGIGRSRAIAITADVFALEESPALAFMPGTKTYFLGFFKYAGHLVPCFDMNSFCSIPPTDEGERKCIISKTATGVLAAIWVDGIQGVRDIALAKSITDGASDIPKPLVPYVVNTCSLGDTPHLLLDLQKLVSDLTSDSVTLY